MGFNQCYQHIDGHATKRMMAERADTMLLDVREADEYRAGYIPESTNIPVGRLQMMQEKLPEDKQAPIITYCLSGIRAVSACQTLHALGYRNIYCLGGLQAWPFGFAR